ncbi:MAG TPA: response regulator [Rickettsiales bacterium]|nr:response regulator [Rickettsiales bacterium]
MPMGRRAEVLLVEDNEGDIELTEMAFLQSRTPSRLWVSHNGQEALDFLMKKDSFGQSPTPDIILLDLNMPRMDGKTFLDVLKRDESLRIIPVIVFTSSNAPKDIAEAYQKHANSYIIKPFSLEEYSEVVKQVEDFWIKLSQLPTVR